jgi:hypothetical protein
VIQLAEDLVPKKSGAFTQIDTHETENLIELHKATFE